MKHSSFDATISALDAETSALDVETSVFGAATSAIARSYRRYRHAVSGDIGDCGVGITLQMCNRVTNHGDMSTFSKPAWSTATFRSTDLLYIIRKNGDFSQAVGDNSFLLWLWMLVRVTSGPTVGVIGIVGPLPLWKLSFRNRVTPVSIQDGV